VKIKQYDLLIVLFIISFFINSLLCILIRKSEIIIFLIFSHIILYFLIKDIYEKKIKKILFEKEYTKKYSGILKEIRFVIKRLERTIEKERKDFMDFYERFNIMFNNISLGIIIINKNNKIEKINKTAKNYFHYLNLRAGYSVSLFLKNADLKIPQYTGIYNLYSRRVKRNFEIQYDKKSDFDILIIKDVTYERKLKRVLELSHDFVYMGEVIGNLSHSLKTPISRLKMTYQMYEITHEESALESLKEEIEILEKSIYNAINLFKTDNLNAESEKINIEKLLKSLKEEYSKIFNFIKFDFHTEEENVYFNKFLFTSFLKNLIQNSVESINEKINLEKYDPKVVLKIKRRNNNLILNIYDNGLGMDENQINNFNKPYYSTKSIGSGVGSIFIERFVYSHNGDYHIKSKKNNFTLFIIKIPNK
jgi:nitrogen fixation/metabolism regulation signal transduction histidine kinase